jgi:hypothetical protein
MAYDTGTASSAANLKSAIETFAQANGWTLSSGVLSKGTSYVRITSPFSYSVKIEGANSSDFATEPCGQAQQMIIPAASFPCSYFLFAHGTPDTLVCVVNYSVVYFQWLAFGQIQKYGSWTGGNWFGASHASAFAEAKHDAVWIAQYRSGYGAFSGGDKAYNSSSGAMWWNCNNQEGFSGTYNGSRSTHMHIRLDGNIWPGAGSGTSAIYPSAVEYFDPLHARSPNAYNSQTVLTPLRIGMLRTDNYRSILGHIGHVRTLRIDNHDPGQVITIGSDKWKVFPWFRKDTDYPLGGVRHGYSGTFGMAVAYDGP